ncbi:MAG: hypothetical protein DSZ27_00910 [Thiomicrospira sp.]|nr:MAG: hypothetical protein DSZ27_00910 [Thiomicrospira sp.]
MSFFDELKQNPDYVKSLRHQELIVDVTEAIYEMMARKNFTKAELARKSGLSKARITKLLDGSANMTLRSVADIAFALGVKPKVYLDSSEVHYANTSHITGWSNTQAISYNPSKKHVIQYKQEVA